MCCVPLDIRNLSSNAALYHFCHFISSFGKGIPFNTPSLWIRYSPRQDLSLPTQSGSVIVTDGGCRPGGRQTSVSGQEAESTELLISHSYKPPFRVKDPLWPRIYIYCPIITQCSTVRWRQLLGLFHRLVYRISRVKTGLYILVTTLVQPVPCEGKERI